MAFRAIRDLIIVEKQEENNTTTSGLIVFNNADKDFVKGVVVSVGSGNIDKVTGKVKPFTLKVGDKVIMTMGCGRQLSDNKEHRNYILIKEEDIFGIYE